VDIFERKEAKRAAHLLEELAAGKRKPSSPFYGLCWEMVQLDFSVEIREFILIQLAPEWPKFSGDILFPIPHYKLPPIDAYVMTRNLWNPRTEYGRDRLELCGWLAKQLRKELRKRK
jgi:hypothetical protein